MNRSYGELQLDLPPGRHWCIGVQSAEVSPRYTSMGSKIDSCLSFVDAFTLRSRVLSAFGQEIDESGKNSMALRLERGHRYLVKHFIHVKST